MAEVTRAAHECVHEFVVDVKRKTLEDGGELWTATVGSSKFAAPSESALRDAVHGDLLAQVSAKTNLPETALTVKLNRTWRVRVTEGEDEAEVPIWSLFD